MNDEQAGTCGVVSQSLSQSVSRAAQPTHSHGVFHMLVVQVCHSYAISRAVKPISRAGCPNQSQAIP